jgi:hypothetical protein
MLSLVAAHPAAFAGEIGMDTPYPGPCFPYATRADIRTGKVLLSQGHAVNFKRNRRLHQYSLRQEQIGESWFI